jgi:hypothetical protein
MSRFYDLSHYDNGSLCKFIEFPCGLVGYPDPTEQNDLAKAMDKAFSAFSELKQESFRGSAINKFYREPGYPIVVYKKLDEGWTRGDKIVGENKRRVKLFLSKLKKVCRLVAAAGIIHTDLRLVNIFYQVRRGRNVKEIVAIKIIDWDDSVRVNEFLPRELLTARLRDIRFPHVNRFRCGIEEYYDFFIGVIEKDLSEVTADSDEAVPSAGLRGDTIYKDSAKHQKRPRDVEENALNSDENEEEVSSVKKSKSSQNSSD